MRRGGVQANEQNKASVKTDIKTAREKELSAILATTPLPRQLRLCFCDCVEGFCSKGHLKPVSGE